MKKGTWIVFGLVVVLGIVYFASRDKQVSVGVKQLKLPVFASNSVDRIEVAGKEPVKLVKRDGIWLLELTAKDAVREVKADQANVESLLEAASSMRSSHYVTNLKEKYPELGFSEDGTVVVKLFAKEAPMWSVSLGKNAAAGGRYGKRPEDDDIYVVRGSFWQLTRNGPGDFREREIWQTKDGEVESFSIIKSDGSSIDLVKGEAAGEWKFADSQKEQPKDFRADKSALAGLVRTGMAMRASSFVDEALSLTAPVVTLKVLTNKGSDEVQLFAHAGDKYLAKRVGDEQIYEVTKNTIDRLNVPVESLRDLSVVKFDKATVNEITLMHGKNRVLVSKKENQWLLVQPAKVPEKFEFDTSAVDDTIAMLSGLTAERMAGPKDVPVSSDWEKQWLVELTTDKDDKIHLFAVKNKANKDEYLVRGNIDRELYVVKSLRLNSLTSGVNAFKKEEFNLPPIDENTKGFESLPVDIQRKLLNVTKEKKQ